MTKLTQLTEDSSPSGTDIAYSVKDPAGSPLSRKVTWAAAVAAGLASALTDLASRWTAASTSAAASLDFREDTDNGTNRVRVTAPASIASDVTSTLPDATGTLALIDTSAYGSGWNGSTKAPTQDAVYDKVETIGTGTYTAYTPTVRQNGDRTISSSTARYTQNGKMVHAYGTATVSNAGTSGQTITVTVPVTPSTNINGVHCGVGRVEDTGTAIYHVIASMNSSTSEIRFFRDSVTTGNAVGETPAFALASGDIIRWSVTYEAA